MFDDVQIVQRLNVTLSPSRAFNRLPVCLFVLGLCICLGEQLYMMHRVCIGSRTM